MNRTTATIFLLLSFVLQLSGQSSEKGPYTVTELASNVWRIEDANKSNPGGVHLDSQGKLLSVNNSSDMYLVLGRDKALLIDLSNYIKWDTTAVTSLRAIVDGTRGDRELYIAVTHFHGDHTGMLPAFKDDPKVKFWVQPAEFDGRNIFPTERTTSISKVPSLDLGGGTVVNSFELPGHTPHSMLYFLKDKNFVFTGDGIGSGHGVWLFSYESFITFKQSIDKLIDYIQDPVNSVNASKLLVYPGHYWQKREKPNLPFQYILDMQTLFSKIKDGTAGEDRVTFNKYLDTEFKYGTAVITWNKADSQKFRTAN